jgi:hypothetical protein
MQVLARRSLDESSTQKDACNMAIDRNIDMLPSVQLDAVVRHEQACAQVRNFLADAVEFAEAADNHTSAGIVAPDIRRVTAVLGDKPSARRNDRMRHLILEAVERFLSAVSPNQRGERLGCHPRDPHRVEVAQTRREAPRRSPRLVCLHHPIEDERKQEGVRVSLQKQRVLTRKAHPRRSGWFQPRQPDG